jgi:hypothetical protein
MKNLEQYKGKFIFCSLVHHSGYTQKWLRRITRTTKTQIIADVQYVGNYNSSKNNEMERMNERAFRMNLKNDQLIERQPLANNKESIRTVSLVEDFNSLKCDMSYDELFNTDLRKIFEPTSDIIEFIDYSNKRRNIENVDSEYKISTILVNDVDHYSGIAKHLKDLFGNIPVYRILSQVTLNTTHDETIFLKTAIHYHININGGDKPYITRKENSGNRTISFWLFDDKIVFQIETGIDSW